MKYNHFLNSTISVSEIGLGAWQLGHSDNWLAMNETEAIKLVRKALDLGLNFFDTAPNYGLGTSEKRLGLALKAVNRDSIVINSKFGHTSAGTLDYRAESIRASLEGSLKRLQTDYIDSLIIHNPPFEMLDGNKNPHYELLERLVEEGKIRAYGASLDTFEEMELFMNTTKGKVIEAFFNILHQSTSKAFKQALKNEVSIIAKIPLDSGWLSGKYTSNTVFEDIRSRWTDAEKMIRFELVERVKGILSKYNLAQASIAFCNSYDAVKTVIPGCKNIAQLTENLKSADVKLSNDEIEKLESFYLTEVKHLKLSW